MSTSKEIRILHRIIYFQITEKQKRIFCELFGKVEFMMVESISACIREDFQKKMIDFRPTLLIAGLTGRSGMELISMNNFRNLFYHVPLIAFCKNDRDIITQAKSYGADKVILESKKLCAEDFLSTCK